MSENLLYLPSEASASEFTSDVETMLAAYLDKVGGCDSLDRVIDLLWETTEGLIGHDRISFAFLEKDGVTVTSHSARVSYENPIIQPGWKGALPGSSLEPILAEGTIRIIHDTEHYLEAHPDSVATRVILKEGIRSNITLPLTVDGRNVGFLFFSSREPDAFTEQHGKILAALLSRTAQVVEKAWIIRRLDATNQDYLSMMGFVSHELKSPLVGIMAMIDTYLYGYAEEEESKAVELMKRMRSRSEYMLGMIAEYLNLARMESGELKFEPEDDIPFKKTILEFAREIVDPHAEQRGDTFRFDQPEEEIHLTCAPDLLRIVVINLLDNAVKYGSPDSTIDVAYGIDEKKFSFTVRNPGVGFTQEDIDTKLFRRFSRLHRKGTEKAKGTGLGLYLSWWIAQKHGGNLTARSEPDQWAEFILTLPTSLRPQS